MTTNNTTETTTAADDDGRIKFQVNPQTKHDTGEWGYMLTAWSHHVSPSQCLASEWLSEAEAAKLGTDLLAGLPNGKDSEGT